MGRRALIFGRYFLGDDGVLFDTVRGKIVKQNKQQKGYLQVRIRNEHGGYVTLRVHRLVAECFVDRGSGTEVNHKDGNKENNHYSNLEWCSRGENISHAYSNGLRKRPSGERNPRAKSTNKEIGNMKWLCSLGLSDGEVASLLLKPKDLVSRVRRGVQWSSVEAVSY